jgi:hypothetical protein
LVVGPDYQGYSFDLTDLSAAADNPDFAIRMLFEGPAAANNSGNNRFDNILLTGDRIASINPPREKDLDCRIYPNPVAAAFFLEWQQATDGDIQLQIMDMTGRPVMDHILNGSNQGKQIAVVDVGRLPAGMYIVILEDRRGTRVLRKMVRD